MTKTQQQKTTTRFRGRLGFTLIMAFVLLAVVPIGILIGIVVQTTNDQAQRQALNQLESIVEAKTLDFERWLGSGDEVINLVLQDTRNYSRLVTIVEAEDPRLAPIEQVNVFLAEKLSVQSIFTEFFVYTLDGEIRSSSDESMVESSVAFEPYFIPSLDNPSYIQPPYFAQDTGNLRMVSTQTLINDNGEVVGVLAGRLNLDTLSEIMLSRVGLGDTGETYLVSKVGSLLITPSRFDGFPVAQPYTSDGIQQVLDSQDGSGDYTGYRNQEVFGVYRWLPSVELGMIGEIDRDEALQTGRDQARQSILVAAFVAILAAGAGIIVATWITRPIEDLTETTRIVSQGDYSRRAAIQRNNEIGELAYSFNHMTDDLVETITKLDHRVEELRIATAKAEEAARLKDEFLAVMSHELRTPLNAIIGFIGIIQMKKDLDDKSAHMLKRVRANGERLLELIDDILNISRMEAGRMELIPEATDVRDMIRRISVGTDVLAEEKGLNFEIQIEPNVPETIMIDPDALHKIISNLVSNAIKFTAEGKVSLDVSREDENLIIAVTDTGMGVPAHMHDTIFERFRQADSTSKRAHGGTGLGLSIVQRLCQVMHGNIRLQSEVGKGSVFTVTLPLEQEEQRIKEPTAL